MTFSSTDTLFPGLRLAPTLCTSQGRCPRNERLVEGGVIRSDGDHLSAEIEGDLREIGLRPQAGPEAGVARGQLG